MLTSLLAILMPFLKTVIGIATPILIGVGTNYISKKTKIMISDDTEKKLIHAVKEAVNYAEEITMVKLKGGDISITNKLEIATDHVLDKLGNVARDVIQNKIHSELVNNGLGATVVKSIIDNK